MSVPTFLDTSHRYLQTNSITDVNTIISDFRSETVTLGSPAWSEPSTALFKSPVDADGRWFDVLLTRISATSLECRTRDSLGNTIVTRRIQIEAGGSNVRYFTGEAHYCIESLRATPETLRGGLIDESPESQTSHTTDTWAWGYRNTSDTPSESFTSASTKDTTTAIAYLQGNGWSFAAQTLSGAYVYMPTFIVNASRNLCGRAYQFYICSSLLADGAEITVPIDVGVTAAFRVLGVAAYQNRKICVRAD